ncbi:hypothetical protein FGO68_gene7626 [Halteria grandinella]|uniref:Uncharacterized protein n=1 Tax=Halteria grandinella TaxID=5974 RepID=A0A8J8NFN0_HALGN|nr:hypothetical protein FGO68_gene7626 [Halteria grandinella]
MLNLACLSNDVCNIFLLNFGSLFLQEHDAYYKEYHLSWQFAYKSDESNQSYHIISGFQQYISARARLAKQYAVWLMCQSQCQNVHPSRGLDQYSSGNKYRFSSFMTIKVNAVTSDPTCGSRLGSAPDKRTFFRMQAKSPVIKAYEALLKGWYGPFKQYCSRKRPIEIKVMFIAYEWRILRV